MPTRPLTARALAKLESKTSSLNLRFRSRSIIATAGSVCRGELRQSERKGSPVSLLSETSPTVSSASGSSAAHDNAAPNNAAPPLLPRPRKSASMPVPPTTHKPSTKPRAHSLPPLPVSMPKPQPAKPAVARAHAPTKTSHNANPARKMAPTSTPKPAQPMPPPAPRKFHPVTAVHVMSAQTPSPPKHMFAPQRPPFHPAAYPPPKSDAKLRESSWSVESVYGRHDPAPESWEDRRREGDALRNRSMGGFHAYKSYSASFRHGRLSSPYSSGYCCEDHHPNPTPSRQLRRPSASEPGQSSNIRSGLSSLISMVETYRIYDLARRGRYDDVSQLPATGSSMYSNYDSGPALPPSTANWSLAVAPNNLSKTPTPPPKQRCVPTHRLQPPAELKSALKQPRRSRDDNVGYGPAQHPGPRRSSKPKQVHFLLDSVYS